MTKALTVHSAGVADVKKEISKKTLLLLLAGIFILALLLRGLAFMRFKDDMSLTGDARNYYLMSHQLADTGVYGYWYDGNPYGGSPGVSNARVTPGYPLFLTAVYAIINDPYLHITAVRLIQAVLGSLSALLGFIFVKRLFKNDWMGLFTALLIAVYPPYIFSATLLLTR
jgi:asparagine N-glycosylation enzyme membrane subunit Stt3